MYIYAERNRGSVEIIIKTFSVGPGPANVVFYLHMCAAAVRSYYFQSVVRAIQKYAVHVVHVVAGKTMRSRHCRDTEVRVCVCVCVCV